MMYLYMEIKSYEIRKLHYFFHKTLRIGDFWQLCFGISTKYSFNKIDAFTFHIHLDYNMYMKCWRCIKMDY